MGLARMSSDEFERASEDNDENNLANGAGTTTMGDAYRGEYIKPITATAEKTKCYENFVNYPVRVEGPEFNRDFTYYLVHK